MKYLFYIIIFLTSIGCNEVKKDKEPISSIPEVIPEVVSTKEDPISFKLIEIEFASLDRSLLLQKLFPEGTVNDTDVVWVPNYADYDAFNEQISDDGLCHTRFDTILETSKYCFVFFKTYRYYNGEIEDCHRCAPIVGIAKFEKSDKGYTFINFKKSIFQLGGYGIGSDFDFTDLNQDLTLLKVKSYWIGTGGVYEYENYYSLTSFKEVFAYTKFESNEGFYDDKTDSNYVETIRDFKVKGQSFILKTNHKKYDKSIKAHRLVSSSEYYEYDYMFEMFVKKCK